MGFELDDEEDELGRHGGLFPEGIEEISDGVFRETRELGEGFASERIAGRKIAGQNEAPEISGEPMEDMRHWHCQSEGMSCAVACQEFVAEELLDRELSERKMIGYAERHGWYENGTPPEDAGRLLESLGLETERSYGGSLGEIEKVLESGGKVMASVSNYMLKFPQSAGIAGLSANHMVEVIGIDRRNPADVRIILNDPGVDNGRGIEHSASDFERAWEMGGRYMISAYRAPSGPEKKSGGRA